MSYANTTHKASTSNVRPLFNKVEFPFGWTTRRVLAGPYQNRPRDVWGVNLMAEQPTLPAKVKLLIKDFATPSKTEMSLALEHIVVAMMSKEPVYIGCRGGLGRTGTVLGCLAVTLGVPGDPVLWVRENYHPHAIETYAQERYVRDFEPDDSIISTLAPAKFYALFWFWKREKLTSR
jgi:hypothetical protein